MMQNAYLLAKIGADTAENEQHFAEILPKIPPRRPWSTQSSPRGAEDEDGEDEQDDVDYNDSANALASAIGSCCLLDGV